MTLAVSASRRFPWRVPALDARVVTGLVLVAASVLGGIRLAQVPAPGIRVLVAAADLDAGHVLSAGDLRTAEVRAPRAFVESLARAGRARPTGRVLQAPVREGAPVALDVLGASVPASREITIPVAPEHALGGAIRVGDRIDVFATFDKGTDLARTRTVAREAIVRGVTHTDGLFGQREGAISAVTVSVQPDAAIGLAFAARNAELDLVRAQGALDGRGRDRFDADSVR
ncbi:MAG: RcpC/CpaB family pilus assembly protein [Acidimicrobiia bacterium]